MLQFSPLIFVPPHALAFSGHSLRDEPGIIAMIRVVLIYVYAIRQKS
jgi:hypothetical protein